MSGPSPPPSLHVVGGIGPASGALAERTDDELMALSQTGARDAFAALVTRHARRLVQLCARLMGSAHAAQELAQETWVTVWEQRARYRASRQFLPWLMTLASNRCRNRLRHQRVIARHAHHAPEVHFGALGPIAEPTQIDALLLQERQRRVRAAMAQLPAGAREALALRFGEELRYDEMEIVLGMSEVTLRSRVFHGLKKLRTFLEHSHEA